MCLDVFTPGANFILVAPQGASPRLRTCAHNLATCVSNLILNMALCVSNGARRGLSPRKSLVVDICVFDQPERRGAWVCVAS